MQYRIKAHIGYREYWVVEYRRLLFPFWISTDNHYETKEAAIAAIRVLQTPPEVIK